MKPPTHRLLSEAVAMGTAMASSGSLGFVFDRRNKTLPANALRPRARSVIMTPSNVAQYEDMLGRLAMQFRRTNDGAARKQIAQKYSDVVDQLIQSGIWQESPPPEDQLPHAYMPAAYFRYWRQ